MDPIFEKFKEYHGLKRAGRFEEAWSVIEWLQNNYPAPDGYASLKSSIVEKKGDFFGAVALQRIVIDCEPQNPIAWSLTGALYHRHGKYQEAA